MVDGLSQPESKVGGDLIVAATPRMQLAPGVANQLDESRFDKRVDVFRRRIVTTTILENRLQAVTDPCSVFHADHVRIFERLAVHDARHDVRLEQSPIEAKRIVEGREARIGFARESPTPHKSNVSLTTSNSRASLCIYASIMQVLCI